MTKQEKNDVIEVLKGKFSQYNNFYVTNTESLTVAQVTKLRNHCFDKQVEMKVAKNTLIKKALESFGTEKYAGVFDSLHNVTALLFSENPKEPALILSTFRKESKGERPELKAAFINGDVFVGDNQLKALTQIKTKNETANYDQTCCFFVHFDDIICKNKKTRPPVWFPTLANSFWPLAFASNIRQPTEPRGAITTHLFISDKTVSSTSSKFNFCV